MIFRFVSILGERYTHGHVFDFFRRAARGSDAAARSRRRPAAEVLPLCRRLRRRDPDRAGRGRAGGSQVYNLGTDETIIVDESIATICAHLGVDPVLEHTGGKRGWAGDSPLIHLDTAKIRSRLGAHVNIRRPM